MTDNPQIFGISDGGYDGPYTFIKVLGIVTNGRVHLVPDSKEQFPERGTVFLSDKYWIPPRGQAAVWRVAPHSSKEHTATYNVVSRGRSGPTELLSIPHASSEPDRIRAALFDGIALGYVSDNEVLIELFDGVVIGPIRADLSRLPDLTGFFCSEDAFRDPLGRWENLRDLDPIEVVHEGVRRRFTSFMQVPQAPGMYDLADFETKLQVVLRFASRRGALEGLTRAKIDALTDLLKDPQVPQKVAVRAEDVLATASNAVLTQEKLASIIETLSEIPRVKAAIEQASATARENEIKRLESEHADFHSDIQSLEAERDRLRHEVEVRRRAAERSSEAIGEAVREKLRKVQEDASDLLATVSVLKPFLVLQRGASVPAIAAAPLTPPDNVVSDADLEQVQNALKANLEAIGVGPVFAKTFSTEVLAAVLAGQPAIFSGSLAPLIAQTCARALAAEATFRIRVPVGLLDSLALEEELSVLESRMRQSETVSVAVLEGMNRSAFEVYGDGLRGRWIESAFRRVPSNGMVFFGTVIRGTSTLALSDVLVELAPVFNTDALPLRDADAKGQEWGTTISVSKWAQWSRTASETTPRQRPELNRLMEAVKGRNPLWERVLDRALRALSTLLPEEGAGSPLASLCFGWLLPRGQSFVPEADNLFKAVRAEIAELESKDVRLVQLLESLEPGGQEQ